MNYLILADARMIMLDFIKLRTGELVTIYTSESRRHEAEALRLAAVEQGGDVLVADIGHQEMTLLRSGEFFLKPPQHMLALMEASNVNLFAVDETYAFRLDHRVNELFDVGEHRSFFALDPGIGTWGYTVDDAEVAQESCRRVLETMKGARDVHLTTARGTDLRLSIEGRECLFVTPFPWRGGPGCYPIPLWGEMNWAPITEKTSGRVVIDGITEATTVLKDVIEPVVWEVEGGRIVNVEGGTNADEFRRLFEIDDGASVIGELGIGANPKALLATQSEKALYGTAHLGLGNNAIYPGGDVTSKVHVDGGIRDVTVDVDGTRIYEQGRLVI